MLEHPEIGWIERTGYPSWMQDDCREDSDGDDDSDRLYEERRDQRLFGD